MSNFNEELLDACEAEQLHLSNAIQDAGFLIATDKDRKVTHVSENVVKYLKKPAVDCLGQSINSLLGSTLNLDTGISLSKDLRRAIFGYKLGDDSVFDILVSQNGEGYLVEVQPAVKSDFRHTRHIGVISELMGYSHNDADITSLYEKTCHIISEMTGFEKVMIYQFQEDWSGEVVAEKSTSNSFPEYIGLRFPADDIPKIARDLYCKTPYRLISDVHGEVVPLIGIKGYDTLDLTYSDLRSVSPVHIEYLNNMEVGASLSFPIMVNDELWGLFALHNPQSRYLSIEQRSQCAEIVSSFAMVVKARITSTRMMQIDTMDRTVSKILSKIDFSKKTSQKLTAVSHEILSLVEASGGAMIFGDEIAPFGTSLPQSEIKRIDEWYMSQSEAQTVSLDCIQNEIPEANGWTDVASGVLAIRTIMKDEPKGLRLYWFRPELPTQIKWAGKPEKIVNPEGSKFPISPRRSFETWTEESIGQSKPWSSADLMAAAKFRAMVLKAILR